MNVRGAVFGSGPALRWFGWGFRAGGNRKSERLNPAEGAGGTKCKHVTYPRKVPLRAGATD
jgi:hypothetical protein